MVKATPEAERYCHIDGCARDYYMKAFAIAWAKTLKWERVQAEIAKCEIVCANCHRVRTRDRGRS